MDISNLKELVIFLCKFAEGAIKSLEDKKFNLLEVVNFIPALTAIGAAIQDIDQVPLEIRDLDDEEQAELIAALREEFDISDDDIEDFVEDAFAAVVAVVALIGRIKDL